MIAHIKPILPLGLPVREWTHFWSFVLPQVDTHGVRCAKYQLVDEITDMLTALEKKCGIDGLTPSFMEDIFIDLFQAFARTQTIKIPPESRPLVRRAALYSLLRMRFGVN